MNPAAIAIAALYCCNRPHLVHDRPLFLTLSACGASVAVELPRNPANRIDLLITDVELKDGDGISLAEETNALRKDAPVLVMSGCREYQAEPPNRILLFCRNFFESGNFWMQ